MTIVPAYGRDYKSKKAVLQDWESDKDFIVASIGRYTGRHINKTDAYNYRDEIDGDFINIRYDNKRKVVVIKL